MSTESLVPSPAPVLRVEGFRDPRLPEERRRALEAAEAEPIDMSADAVLAAAREREGLSDFGSPDFLTRLGRLLGEVDADENVWRTAKAEFFDVCVKAAAGRLRNHAFLAEHPEVEREVIDRPVFVVGLPRSGTTHLENLVAADRRLRHLPVWLGFEPVPRPGEAASADGQDPRWLRANRHWEALKADPVRAAMHDYSPDHACGDNELQMPDFASYQWEWLAAVPGWRDHYLSHDQTPHYEYGRTMLKALAWQLPDERRWMLKSNQHNEQLPVLRRVYPDATVVMIHRDPLATLQSVLTMRGRTILSSQKRPDVAAHVRYWVDRVERMLRAYMRDMQVFPAEQRVDLRFQDVMADDVGSAERVLRTAGLPPSDESRKDLSDYMAQHPRGKAGRIGYDLGGDFGLDPAELRERFRFYTEAFDVAHEVRT